MSDLIPQRTAIAFPGDRLGQENNPWGLYHLLGLEGGESREEVKDKARQLMGDYHPDKENGDRAAFQTISEVKDLLTETDDDLGDGLSFKERYDEWSEMNELFSDAPAGAESLINDHFSRKEAEKRQARMKRDLQQVDSRNNTNYFEQYTQVEEQFENAGSMEEIIEAQVERYSILSEAFDVEIDLEDIEQDISDSHQEKKKATEKVVRNLKSSFRKSYSDQLWEVEALGDLGFVKESPEVKIAYAEEFEDRNVLHMKTAPDAALNDTGEIYAKVMEGDVSVTDPGLEGTIHVIDGDIDLEIGKTTVRERPPIVEARAPEVETGKGYEHEQNDVYVPTGRDSDDPDLVLATKEGSISLSHDEIGLDSYSKDIDSLLDGNTYSNDLSKY